MIELTAQNSSAMFQMDVKLAFLHGDLQGEIFIDQPFGYVKLGIEHKFYKLKKGSIWTTTST